MYLLIWHGIRQCCDALSTQFPFIVLRHRHCCCSCFLVLLFIYLFKPAKTTPNHNSFQQIRHKDVHVFLGSDNCHRAEHTKQGTARASANFIFVDSVLMLSQVLTPWACFFLFIHSRMIFYSKSIRGIDVAPACVAQILNC